MADSCSSNYQHGSGGVTAAQFFDVPEITERVLLCLHIADVLAMQQVKKRNFSVIEGSKKPQRKMHILPLPNCAFHPLNIRPCDRGEAWSHPALHNLEVTLKQPSHSFIYEPALNHATITVKLKGEDYTYPPGSRIVNMLVSQSPVAAFDVTFECCGDTSRGQEDY